MGVLYNVDRLRITLYMYHCSSVQRSLNFSNVTENNMYYPTGKYNIEGILFSKRLEIRFTVKFIKKLHNNILTIISVIERYV